MVALLKRSSPGMASKMAGSSWTSGPWRPSRALEEGQMNTYGSKWINNDALAGEDAGLGEAGGRISSPGSKPSGPLLKMTHKRRSASGTEWDWWGAL